MNEWFIVKDLDTFIDATRVMVFVNFGVEEPKIDFLSTENLSKTDLAELNKVLSFNESLLIAKSHMKRQKHKKLKQTRHLISEKNYTKLVHDLHSRMVSNLITQLVKKGLVETAFDEKSNDFIFWVKDKNDQTEKPETD